MGCWYNDRPMTYATPDFRRWWKTYNPDPQERPFGKLAGVPWTHYQIDYPDTWPKLEPGKLWWPTGAGRWGVYYGLADEDTVASWRSETTGSGISEIQNNPGIFYMDDRADVGRPHDYIEKPMYMLPPRPLTFSFGEKPIYLVTLVDERYFWWDVSCGDLSKAPLTTWKQIFEFIRDKLGYDETEFQFTEPSEEYYKPGDLLARASDIPIPVLFDAAAWSVGCRVVVEFDYDVTPGKVIVQNITDAKTVRNTNLALMRLLSGGQHKFQGTFNSGYRDAAYLVSEKTLVSFPRYKYGFDQRGDTEEGRTSFEIKTNDITGYEGYKTGGVTVIHDTAHAYPNGDTDDKLKKLSKLIAQDLLDWTTESNIDCTCYGLRFQEACGLYDFIEYHEYIEDATDLQDDEETGFVIRNEQQRTIAYTKVVKPPFFWRAFTLHHSVGGSSSSTAANRFTWVIDCGTGSVVLNPNNPPVPCVPDPNDPKKCLPTSSSSKIVPRVGEDDGGGNGSGSGSGGTGIGQQPNPPLEDNSD